MRQHDSFQKLIISSRILPMWTNTSFPIQQVWSSKWNMCKKWSPSLTSLLDLKAPVFFMWICIKTYTYIYIYTPYITWTHLQIHQQSCMFPQEWASTWGKGLPPLCTTYTLLWSINKGTFYLWYQAATFQKKILTPLFLVHTIDYFPWKKWNILPATALLSLLISLELCTFESLTTWTLERMIWSDDKLVDVHWILSHPILHCWGQEEDLCKAF